MVYIYRSVHDFKTTYGYLDTRIHHFKGLWFTKLGNSLSIERNTIEITYFHICNIIKTIFFNFGKVLFPHGNCIWSCCIYNHSISNWLAAWRRRSNITLPNQFSPNIKHSIFVFQHIWFFLTQTPWYCALKTVAHMKACFRRLTHDWKTTFHLARWLHFSTLLVVAHAFYRRKNSVASLDNL